MEHINTIKVAALTVLGVVGSFIISLLGGWSSDLMTLTFFMGVDIVMGLIVAGVFKKSKKSLLGAIQSEAFWKGFCRKIGSLVLVAVAHHLDLILGLDYIRTATIIGFILNELISIFENAGLMGIKLPSALTKALDILNDKEEEEK